jgi:S-methylmethionine-dependent homocysteine/selenocysteine methylase
LKHSTAYSNILDHFKDDQCVILDGAIATELQRSGASNFELSDDTHWGFDALHMAPETVQAVHQNYLSAGAEVLTTNTYSILDAPSYTADYDIHVEKPIHWMDLARLSIELPRKAIAASAKESSAVVAFSIGGEIENQQQRATVELLLGKVFVEAPPDLVLFETLSLIDDNLTLDTIRMIVDAGIPVWVSFRRCRKGVCGIHGQLWGGPEGDRFGRLAQSLETIGVDALMINCMPINRVDGTLAWLRDFTSLPLGVYPNLGRFVESGWKFDETVSAQDYSEIALGWREEGAQIIGGCCGVGPAEIAAMASALKDIPKGNRRDGLQAEGTAPMPEKSIDASAFWHDQMGRDLFPLPFPKISVDPGVFVPTQGSFLIWKYLFNSGIGKDSNCLDVGCGVGILAVQLALNGANHVTAFDIQPEAVDNTLTNAFRNGVADRMTGVAADLYAFLPEHKFDVIVASLYQMPTNPKGHTRGHRDIDYWGRNLLDHFIKNLKNYMAEGGTAYLMQVSMLGARRTQDLLARHGFQAQVVDFNLYQFNPVFSDNIEQIKAVEKLSDAYHFRFGPEEHTMVMYLLKIVRR